MVVVTLVPVEDAAGFTLLNVQPMPAGEPTITQPSATLPVKPFKPFTRIVSAMFVPTLAETVAVFAVTEKSLTDSVTFADFVVPIELAVSVMVADPVGVVLLSVKTVTA